MFELARNNYLCRQGLGEIHLKAVLIDMDGVLYDSMPSHVTAWTKAITAYGLHITPQEVYLNEGRTGKSTINMLTRQQLGRDTNDDEVAAIYARKCEEFNSLPPVKPMPGAAQLLAQAKECGLTPVLVTGSGQRTLLTRLERDFPGTFTAQHMVTSFDVSHGKPSPEPYLVGLKKAGATRGEAIVIENAPLGVRAGVGAGVFTVAVNTGPLDNSVLLAEGANLIFSSMKDLSDSWPQLYAALK